MNQDGTPVKADIKDTGRYNNDPIFRAAADAAHRADHESALPALAVVAGKIQLPGAPSLSTSIPATTDDVAL